MKEIGLLGRKSQQRRSDFPLLGELLPTASNEKKGLMPAGGVSRIPYFRYSSDNVYKLEYPFYGIVGGHSDRTNTTSLMLWK